MPMTLTQKSAPYAHWDFVHPSSGDRLRIIPERGGSFIHLASRSTFVGAAADLRPSNHCSNAAFT